MTTTRISGALRLSMIALAVVSLAGCSSSGGGGGSDNPRPPVTEMTSSNGDSESSGSDTSTSTDNGSNSSPSTDNGGDNSTSTGNEGDHSPSTGNEGDNSTSTGNEGNNSTSTSTGNGGDNSTSTGNGGNNSTSAGNGGNSSTGPEVTPPPVYGTLTDGIPDDETLTLNTANLSQTTSRDGFTGGRPSLSNQATIEVVTESHVRLRDPASGVNTLLKKAPDGRYSDGEITLVLTPTDWLDYTKMGVWISTDDDPSQLNYRGFVGGYPTLSTDMPTSGTASYHGGTRGVASSNSASNSIEGNANMTVDFTDGTLNGAFTDMRVASSVYTSATGSPRTDHTPRPWNDVSFTANLNDNTFAGRTRVTSVPDSAEAFNADASGDIEGRFFGPQAAEAGGAWSLKDSSGNSAAGHFAVKQ
ncbi:transferrin-binding protein-like solute binding protein [Halomonas cupida]|uniref:transferrin-binding protein-like solute binding protein n=1 Tax=Halomonas cupida TaxID=44933 RepID=UPI003A916B37